MINLKNISKSYKDICLFKNVDLTIPENSRIAFQGTNGSGKSVLLKLICGYAKADEGVVVIDDLELGKDCSFIQNAGISINAPEFIGSMSGIDNLLYLSNIKKVATKEDILKLAEILELEGLNKKYKTYSLGMKQKMRLIQALMEKPKYLILDEPFDALDKKSKEIAKQLLLDYSKENTLLFVSHDPTTLTDLAEIVYEIDDYNLRKVERI